MTKHGGPAETIRRANSPWLFVEFIAIAALYRDGEMVFDIARLLQRPVPQIRSILFGADA